MHLAEKIRHLRQIEGELRGFNRAMTQMEVVRIMQDELGESISQAYISQLENSKRLHLTASTRSLLARFFKVHPGYLVNDSPLDSETDHHQEQESDQLRTWLIAKAVEWRSEPVLQDLLAALAQSKDPLPYLAAFRCFMRLSIEELSAIVEALISSNSFEEAQSNSVL